jgi:transposase
VAAPKKYPDELRARAVRLYRESDPKPVIRQLARQLGVGLLRLAQAGRTA